VTIDQQIGKRLNAFRIDLGISQISLSEILEVRQGYLNQVIHGKKGISAKVIINITRAYKDLNLRWLLTGEGEMWETQNVSDPVLDMLANGKADVLEESVRVEYLKPDADIHRRLDEMARRLSALEKKNCP